MGVNQCLKVEPYFNGPLLCVLLKRFKTFLNFKLFFFILAEKDVKMQKKVILTRERQAKHLFPGLNTQHMFKKITIFKTFLCTNILFAYCKYTQLNVLNFIFKR